MTEKEAIVCLQSTPFFRMESMRKERTGEESENDLFIAMKMAIVALERCASTEDVKAEK